MRIARFRIALLRRIPLLGRIALLRRIPLLRRVVCGRVALLRISLLRISLWRITLGRVAHWSCQLRIGTCHGSREDVNQHSDAGNQQETDEPAPTAKHSHFDERPDPGDQANYSTGHI